MHVRHGPAASWAVEGTPTTVPPPAAAGTAGAAAHGSRVVRAPGGIGVEIGELDHDVGARQRERKIHLNGSLVTRDLR